MTPIGILQARILECVAFPFSRGSSQPRDFEPRSPSLPVDSLPAEPEGKPKNTGVGSLTLLQQIFPTQESNQGLLHFKWILYQLRYLGSPTIYKSLSKSIHHEIQFSSVQLFSHVRLFATPWTAASQASLSITNFRSSPKLMSIESAMPSNHLILGHPLLLLPSIFRSIRVFSNESAFHMRWPKYWSFSFNISPSNEHPGLISFRMDWFGLLAVQGTLKSLL